LTVAVAVARAAWQ
jgi:hypothetical protein